jgi:hypothetical protein
MPTKILVEARKIGLIKSYLRESRLQKLNSGSYKGKLIIIISCVVSFMKIKSIIIKNTDSEPTGLNFRGTQFFFDRKEDFLIGKFEIEPRRKGTTNRTMIQVNFF